MNLGIVGHGAEKFTPETEVLARGAMAAAARYYGATAIVSGHSPLGGIDIWAEELATEAGLRPIIHAPTRHSWMGAGGYMDRNMQIASDSALVLCVVVAAYRPGYIGMRFETKAGRPFCYHCKDAVPEHVKSGGCWTAWKCAQRAWAIIAPTSVTWSALDSPNVSMVS